MKTALDTPGTIPYLTSMNSNIQRSGPALGPPSGPADPVRSDSPRVSGIHHVRIPVSDVTASAAWYSEVFGLQVILIEEEEYEVVGTVFSVGEGTPRLGLHHDATRAAALAGFSAFAMAVDSRETLSEWDEWLTRVDAPHTPIERSALGWYIDISDPDGLIVQLHTPEHPSVEES